MKMRIHGEWYMRIQKDTRENQARPRGYEGRPDFSGSALNPNRSSALDSPCFSHHLFTSGSNGSFVKEWTVERRTAASEAPIYCSL